jgi:hypothetical protein
MASKIFLHFIWLHSLLCSPFSLAACLQFPTFLSYSVILGMRFITYRFSHLKMVQSQAIDAAGHLPSSGHGSYRILNKQDASDVGIHRCGHSTTDTRLSPELACQPSATSPATSKVLEK